MKGENVRKMVRERYGKVPSAEKSCCDGNRSCCSGANYEQISSEIGYTKEDLAGIPDGANFGLGCGNPVALASLKPGETVMDLGSGAGIDCFIAAKKVGPKGKVIGVDMTQEMMDKARENARTGGFKNVEFRLGEIENLPAADNSVDVIISNCVINLSPDKPQVFKEAFRVLRPGGRLMVSDLVLLKPLPAWARESVNLYVGCVAGAMLKKQYLGAISAAGFSDIRVEKEDSYPADLFASSDTMNTLAGKVGITTEEINKVAKSVVSVKVGAVKPARATSKKK